MKTPSRISEKMAYALITPTMSQMPCAGHDNPQEGSSLGRLPLCIMMALTHDNISICEHDRKL